MHGKHEIRKRMRINTAAFCHFTHHRKNDMQFSKDDVFWVLISVVPVCLYSAGLWIEDTNLQTVGLVVFWFHAVCVIALFFISAIQHQVKQSIKEARISKHKFFTAYHSVVMDLIIAGIVVYTGHIVLGVITMVGACWLLSTVIEIDKSLEDDAMVD